MANAEAEAAIIEAQTEIEITDLHRRAMHRFVEEEANRQQNIETITDRALLLLTDQSDAEAIEDDWVTNFFDKSRIVSDNEMQDLWARVLAGEANSPGSYSRRTVNCLGDLDKTDAELFIKLCGFGWQIGNVVPLIFALDDDIYKSCDINFNSLSHLESIGLIQFGNLAGFKRRGLPQHLPIFYYGQPLLLKLPKDEGENDLELGKVLLTKIGQELAPICGGGPVDGFMDHVRKRWRDYLSIEASEQSPEQESTADADSNGGSSPPPC
ncbi:MAG: DUF2806 domain-containing protein [Planctomycetes bacterium]|nr:DUF2806 domain-containing protein [Planctomycetota bacterium]MBL7036991.1 DUF2806 domain-containing protein [Pirellulaceae bacterium]